MEGSTSEGKEGDKYRKHLHGEGEKHTSWRYGAPPDYTLVNQLFEQGRTKVWPPGSLEEKVQNLVKSWEMENFHKTNPNDYKVMNPAKYTISLNGRKSLNMEEKRKLGGAYNTLLLTSLPKNLRCYDPDVYTREASVNAFQTAFPRGFAIEILEVYSGPPKIVYKFRHWGYMEGPFQGHAPTGALVEFFGMAKFEVDENMVVEKVEFFYDRGELLGALVKGPKIEGKSDEISSLGCPILNQSQ